MSTAASAIEQTCPRDLVSFCASAQKLLGRPGWTCDADVMAQWLTDWRGRYTGRALAMASPASTDEVAALVRLCARSGVPIVPQGGNSGMSGGATPDTSGRSILLSLRRLRDIGTVDRAARQIRCGAGVILSEVHDAASAYGLRFPLSLGAKGSATIGGLIATNAGGTQALRHGSMRAQVAGLEVVLPDGTIWSALTPLKKDNRGFDLKQLFIGSEGTLGIVTAATLALVPAPSDRLTLWVGLQSMQAARALLVHCSDGMGDALEAFEVLPQSCLDAVLDYLPNARAPLDTPYPWHALVEFVGAPEGGVTLRDRTEALFANAFESGLLDDAVFATSDSQSEAFWTIRESISAAERAKGPAMQHDVAVPVPDMPDFVDAAVAAVHQAFPGTHAFGFGHLGDGNVHFHVLAPAGAKRADWEAGDGEAISRLVHDLVTQWHGSISAEHGIGQMKRDEFARLGDPAALGLLGAVKRALDPRHMLNPGKLIG